MADYGTYNTDWAAIAQAGANLLGSTAQMIYQGEADSWNRKLFKETRDMQRQWALEDYEKVLRDSSPAEQVRRLKEAGLNPNLVYGSGTVQTGVTSAPSMPSMLPPYKQRGLDLDLSAVNAFGTLLDMQLKKAQIRKIEKEADKTESETKGQNLANSINEATKDIQIALASNRNSEVMANIRKLDADVRNQSFLTDSQIRLNNEQIDSIIQARFVQMEELDLSKKQIGAQIRQGFMHAQAALKSADASQLNAAGNYLNAHSNALRNSKLNELTDVQIGTMVLENRRLQQDMQYDSARLESEEQRREAIYQRNRKWDKNFGWTGITFDDFRSLIPFAPSVGGEYSEKNGMKWKF